MLAGRKGRKGLSFVPGLPAWRGEDGVPSGGSEFSLTAPQSLPAPTKLPWSLAPSLAVEGWLFPPGQASARLLEAHGICGLELLAAGQALQTVAQRMTVTHACQNCPRYTYTRQMPHPALSPLNPVSRTG